MLQVSEGMVLADRYVVGRKLGAGGSGSVWQAMDRVLERQVAVKIVPDGVGAARLAREARAAAGIGVRNVVAVYDAGELDGAHFLVMEFVDGVDLATLLAVHGTVPIEVAALVGHEVARGVAAVHEASLVHRDVTPANVLVTTEGEVKLTDLGIAHRTGDDATRRLTEVGTVVGTVDYLAPEQVEGGDVTPASDVYAVGLLLYEVVSGAPAFGDGSVPERLARRLHAPPPRLDGDEQLAAIVARATAIDPSDRYADGSALRTALAPLVPDDDQVLRGLLAALVEDAHGVELPRRRASTTDSSTAVALPGPRRAAEAGPEPPASSPDATTAIAAQPAPADDAVAPTGDGAFARAVMRAAFGALAVVVLIALATTLRGAGSDSDPNGGGQEAAPLTVAAAVDHDPLGDGDEHPATVGLAVDGDDATEWDTEGYETPALSGLKSGVGLLLDLGEVRDVVAVEVLLGVGDVDLTVTVSDERPEGDPTASATVLATADDAPARLVQLEGDPVSGRWVAIWFTQLGEDGSRFRAALSEVRVFGG